MKAYYIDTIRVKQNMHIKEIIEVDKKEYKVKFG